MPPPLLILQIPNCFFRSLSGGQRGHLIHFRPRVEIVKHERTRLLHSLTNKESSLKLRVKGGRKGEREKEKKNRVVIEVVRVTLLCTRCMHQMNARFMFGYLNFRSRSRSFFSRPLARSSHRYRSSAPSPSVTSSCFAS